jgi:hypothetical protein
MSTKRRVTISSALASSAKPQRGTGGWLRAVANCAADSSVRRRSKLGGCARAALAADQQHALPISASSFD